MSRSFLVLPVLALFSAASQAAASDPCQQAVAKGTFAQIAVPGADFTYVSGINNRGQIVGTYTAAAGTSGFLLEDGEYRDIHIAGSTSTRVADINAHGVLVGSYDDGAGSHGFIWDDGDVVTLDVPGAIYTSANGINDAGTVVGLINAPGGIDGIERGFVYRDGEFQIVDYPGAGGTSLLDINNAGVTLGGAFVNPTQVYFLYKGGAFTAVPVCNPLDLLIEITNRGDLIGGSRTGVNAPTLGTVVTSRGVTLVHPPGAAGSLLWGGNNAGVLVGQYYDLAGYQYSFVFTPH
jgi:hypothetical protein